MDKLTLKINEINVSVSQDDNGRYSLNDIFRASGSKDKNKPSKFLRSAKHISVIKAWDSTGDKNVPCEKFDKTIVQTKINRATVSFAPLSVVYKYASFISSEFEEAVYKAFSELSKGNVEKAANIASSFTITPEIVAKHKRLYDKLMQKISELYEKDKHAHSNFNRLLSKASTGFTPYELTGGYTSALAHIKEHDSLPAINAMIASIETALLLMGAGVTDYHVIATVLKVKTTKNAKTLSGAL